MSDLWILFLKCSLMFNIIYKWVLFFFPLIEIYQLYQLAMLNIVSGLTSYVWVGMRRCNEVGAGREGKIGRSRECVQIRKNEREIGGVQIGN